MGFRTVVVLSNDDAHEWEADPELGKKIMHSAMFNGRTDRDAYFPYGEIVEQVHADTQTLVVLDGYGGKSVARRSWYPNQSSEERNLALLKELANSMGYTLRKKSEK